MQITSQVVIRGVTRRLGTTAGAGDQALGAVVCGRRHTGQAFYPGRHTSPSGGRHKTRHIRPGGEREGELPFSRFMVLFAGAIQPATDGSSSVIRIMARPYSIAANP